MHCLLKVYISVTMTTARFLGLSMNTDVSGDSQTASSISDAPYFRSSVFRYCSTIKVYIIIFGILCAYYFCGMEPVGDIIRVLLEISFSVWKDEEKKDVLQCERPQPILSIKKQLPREKTGKVHARNFQKSWYNCYSWLCGSYYLQKLFCWPCLLVGVKKGIWNNSGFDNLLIIWLRDL